MQYPFAVQKTPDGIARIENKTLQRIKYAFVKMENAVQQIVLYEMRERDPVCGRLLSAFVTVGAGEGRVTIQAMFAHVLFF